MKKGEIRLDGRLVIRMGMGCHWLSVCRVVLWKYWEFGGCSSSLK